jgi:hypothetical protein
MPLNAKGEKILNAMEETYGSEKKAKSVLYASKNAGKITGIDATFGEAGPGLDEGIFGTHSNLPNEGPVKTESPTPPVGTPDAEERSEEPDDIRRMVVAARKQGYPWQKKPVERDQTPAMPPAAATPTSASMPPAAPPPATAQPVTGGTDAAGGLSLSSPPQRRSPPSWGSLGSGVGYTPTTYPEPKAPPSPKKDAAGQRNLAADRPPDKIVGRARDYATAAGKR